MERQFSTERHVFSLFSVGILLRTILACSAAEAADPPYYVKKNTWQESMRASRQALVEFEAQELSEQTARLKELGIQLGPWYSIGPFSSPNADPYGVVFEPERKINLDKTYRDGKLKWTKRQWQDGVIHSLSGDGKSGEGKIVADYMFRNIASPQDTTLPVYLGSNDGIQVWFNGERVLAKDIGRQAAPDQDVVNLNFKVGDNKLLIKVNNRAAAHAFYFSMHPAGGVRLQRGEELFNLLGRDFSDQTARRQMKWEREDNIWDKDCDPADLAALAGRYAKATRDIGSLPAQAGQAAVNVKTPDQLQQVREVYYRSRSCDDSIKSAEAKLRLATNQFTYVRGKFTEKKDDAQLKDYKTRLESLQNTANKLLAGARAGDSAAIEKLAKLEDDLLKLHKSQLPVTPSLPKSPACFAFDLKQVRLLDGPFKRAMELDRKYLYDLDSDRLLHTFRVTAGLPSSAEPLGGWEKRELRGHTMGHYLSACALMYASTGDERLKAKADAIVAELAKCQKVLGNGYLGGFPEEGIKRVIYGTGGWWAPWYTYHKIVAGLLDMYSHCGNQQALETAKGMAAWTKTHLDNINQEQTQRMLEVEFGGMNEVLCNLYAITRNPDHLATARRFDHQMIFEPLAHFEDKLTGLHVNTQIPKIIGAAREFELTGEPYYYNIATFFWDQVVNARSYCTGGTSNHEHWRTEPYVLAKELSPATQETCCTYNMLKLTRHLFCWNPDVRYADYYERALFNSILSTQDPETGMMMYFVPLASGYWKIYNTPYDSFWCCTGTGIENHAKYGDSIYFHDENGVYVNLFIASELDWPEKGVRIRQETGFPEEEGTTLIVKTRDRTKLALNIRIPYWATKPVTVTINNKKSKVYNEPGSYITLNRKWKDGDQVRINMPMSLHLDRMPDDPSLAAIMYGPLVLAGRLGTEGLNPKTVYAASQGVLRNYQVDPGPSFVADAGDLQAWIKPVAGKPLTFQTADAGKPSDVTLVPFHKLFGQRYAIYWRIQAK
ncbi:MAG TPA: beta-L-arabinofuranosidase domain-containing protein [Sedimentisphaerales bacterium]|nr:beta-L-arabinofuranosidase domain-containing protein [Sedimentisphaerales bacterium]